MIKIEVMENGAGRRYIHALWMNGLFPMAGDINSKRDLRHVHRLAEDMGQEVYTTNEAREWLEAMT